MESSRRASDRLRRTLAGAEPECVQAPFFFAGWHTQGGKGESTSYCSGTVQSAWCSTSNLDALKTGLYRKGVMVTTWCGDDSLHLSLPNSQPLSTAVRWCARVTGKAGEKGQNSGDGTPGVVTHSRPQRATSRSEVGNQRTWLWGSQSTGSPARSYSCVETARCTFRFSDLVLAKPPEATRDREH